METSISGFRQSSTGLRSANAPKIALIGISGYAGVVLDSIRAICAETVINLVAVTSMGRAEDMNSERVLHETGIPIYRDYRNMLSDAGSIDLCIIPTGIQWHTRMSLDALAIGANVLVEKPLAGSVRDASKIISATKRSRRFVAVGFQDLYSGITHEIKDFLSSGDLGHIRRIRVTGSWPRLQAYFKRNNWAGRKQIDGWDVRDSPINNAFAHFLNLALFFSAAKAQTPFSDITSCSGNLYRCYPIETYDTVAVNLITNTNVRVECAVTHADGTHSDPEICIDLEGGTLVWRFEKEAIATTHDGERIMVWELPASEASRRCMLANVVGCSAQGTLPMCTAEMALSHCIAIEKIESTLAVVDLQMRRGATNCDPWTPRLNVFSKILEETNAE